MDKIKIKTIEHARDLGAVTYLSAYVHLMAHHLGIDADDNAVVKAMAVDMVEPINRATEAAWCALMNDRDGMAKALTTLKELLEELAAQEEPKLS